ncbi:unnamed protein product [Cyclocybe aegerita]|uniref:Uncharacterized protein n=1 Tax=Cyclocybe aegerita TaxID=1973307 RepID=A0A8S0W788_CYCAE|nr:unnamed protein product [Cyclocybe aegerita]
MYFGNRGAFPVLDVASRSRARNILSPHFIAPSMSFSTRNSYYLRISKNTVLPIYVYLDERHVDWMSDAVLQHVLADLRPHVLPKHQAEADSLTGGGGSSSKKATATVDTHRGDSYQFCYFIRKTEPHSVVIKTRNFRAAPPQPKRPIRPQQTVSPSKSKKGKRKETATATSPSRTRSKKRKTADTVQEDDEDVNMDDPQDGDNITMQEEPSIELQIEEEEEKPKPILTLTYQGFNIYGHCLCVVVEPWPVVRHALATSSVVARKTPFDPPPRKAIASQAGSSSDKGKQPLFLPEDDDEPGPPGRTAGQHVNKAFLDQVFLGVIDISDDEDEEQGGMIEFSHVLHNAGDSRAGAINDDEDMDGSVLFGDADEFREL